MCAFAFALVFEHLFERVPCGGYGVAAVLWGFEHFFHVGVFAGDEVVLVGVVRREFVQEITPLARDSLVVFDDFSAVCLPVGRAMFFQRERSLLSLESVAVGLVRFYGLMAAGQVWLNSECIGCDSNPMMVR